MPWVRYDDQFPHHPKVAEVKLHDRAALALHLLCGTWSAGTSTPGLVSEAATVEQAGNKARAKKWATVLVNADLWHRPGHDCDRCPPITKGFVIHDWKVYNPYEELSKKRSDAGRKGAAARWGKPPGGHGNRMANAIPEPSASHGVSISKPVAENAPSPSPSPIPTFGGSSGGSPSHHLQVGDARPETDDDEDLDKLNETIEGRIIEVLREETTHTVDRIWASKIRRQILDGRDIRNPLAYAASAIRGEPAKYLPAAGGLHDQPPPELNPADPDVAHAGAAQVREAMLAAKSRGES